MRIDEFISRTCEVPFESCGSLAVAYRSGIDLMTAKGEIARGTPVYVEAETDVIEVQKRMVRTHVRMVAVLAGDRLLGFVDLVELALALEERGGRARRPPAAAGSP